MNPISARGGRRILITLAGAMVALAGAANAAQEGPRPRLDANGDGVIDRAEAAKAPRLAERFDSADVNRDGKLQRDELAAMRRHGDGHRGERGGHGGIARLDRDGDGTLSHEEAAAHAGLAARFEQIDGDRDGRLSREELGAHRRAHGAERQQRMQRRFAEADDNGDGRLSREEAQALPKLAGRFDQLDRNGDGFIARDELGHGRR